MAEARAWTCVFAKTRVQQRDSGTNNFEIPSSIFFSIELYDINILCQIRNIEFDHFGLMGLIFILSTNPYSII